MSSSAATILRLVPPLQDEEPAVVAEILADGTVRPRDPAVRSRIHESKPEWTAGQLSTGDWILWWQRRS